jgi:cell division protein FtsB
VTDFAELMQRRMALVERLAALNSKQLLNTQTRSGLEVELLACIEEIEANGESEVALARRAELEARYKAAAAACADCEREIDKLADDLDAFDQAGPGP